MMMMRVRVVHLMKCVRLHLSSGWIWFMSAVNCSPHLSISSSRRLWLQWRSRGRCVKDGSASASEETRVSPTSTKNTETHTWDERHTHLITLSPSARSLLTNKQTQIHEILYNHGGKISVYTSNINTVMNCISVELLNKFDLQLINWIDLKNYSLFPLELLYSWNLISFIID